MLEEFVLSVEARYGVEGIWFLFSASQITDSSDFECVVFIVEFALDFDSTCPYSLVSYLGAREDFGSDFCKSSYKILQV